MVLLYNFFVAVFIVNLYKKSPLVEITEYSLYNNIILNIRVGGKLWVISQIT